MPTKYAKVWAQTHIFGVVYLYIWVATLPTLSRHTWTQTRDIGIPFLPTKYHFGSKKLYLAATIASGY